jgi:hypothetical protein
VASANRAYFQRHRFAFDHWIVLEALVGTEVVHLQYMAQ